MLHPGNPPRRGLRLLLLAAIIAAVLPVVWYLGSPLFLNQTVNEGFPSAAMPTIDRPAGEQSRLSATPMPNETAAQPAETRPGPVDATTGPAVGASGNTEPVVLGSGEFDVVDTIHRGGGKATLYRLADGQRVLRFADFRVTNGPDLYVYLSGHPAPRNSAQLHEGAAFEVARLKGNVGSQNYELPLDVDLSSFKSVVIYCKRFSTVFSTAELS